MADITIDSSTLANLQQRWGDIEACSKGSDVYVVYIDSNGNLVYQTSADDGVTWGGAVNVHTAAGTNTVVRWAVKATWSTCVENVGSDIIHIVGLDNGGTDECFHYTLDISSDTVSSKNTVNAETISTTVANNEHWCSVTVTATGRIHVTYREDAVSTFKYYTSDNSGSTWTSRATPSLVAAGTDLTYLTPANTDDDDDVCCFYYDDSASIAHAYIFDATATTWANTASWTVAGFNASLGGTVQQFSVTIEWATRDGVGCFWNAYDSATADLVSFRCTLDSTSSNTVLTSSNTGSWLADVSTDNNEAVVCDYSVDQQNNDHYAWFGNADTAWQTDNNCSRKISTDGGRTWGSRVDVSDTADDIRNFMVVRSISPQDGGRPWAAWPNQDTDDLMTNDTNQTATKAAFTLPTSSVLLGKWTSQNAKIDAALVGFSFLIRADGNADDNDFAGLWTGTADGGGDLRFTHDEAGLIGLSCEVVLFQQSDDTCQVWVRPLAKYASGSDIDICWVWGEGTGGPSQPAAGAAFGKNSVWRAEYAAVYHLDEAVNTTADGYKDATSNNNHGTGVSMAIAASAVKVGLGQDFDGTADYIEATGLSLASQKTVTMEGFGQRGATSAKIILATDPDVSDSDVIELFGFTDAKIYTRPVRNAGNVTLAHDTTTVHQYCFVFDGNGADSPARNKLYIDGVSQSMTGSNTATITKAGAGTLRIGRVAANYSNCKWDDVRIATNPWPAAWVNATFETADDPLAFAVPTAAAASTFVPYPNPRGMTAGMQSLSGGVLA